jgi:hypothetical protein
MILVKMKKYYSINSSNHPKVRRRYTMRSVVLNSAEAKVSNLSGSAFPPVAALLRSQF